MPPSGVQLYGPQFSGDNQQILQPCFQYSQCIGKKKVVAIGINYIGMPGIELEGCHNDVTNLVKFLCEKFRYKREDIRLLTDDPANRNKPTRTRIIAAMQWLVKDAQPNDSLFFYYSGHGGQTKDRDGDERDGFDEAIVPVDYVNYKPLVSGYIVDDEMHEIMVKPLPAGCRLTAIFDSCHSGSALDLPYVYSTEGKLKEPNLTLEAWKELMDVMVCTVSGDMKGAMRRFSSAVKIVTVGRRADEHARKTRTSPADVVSFSGCKDSQIGVDTYQAGEATGAMSYAFMKALKKNPQQSYQELLNNIRTILKQENYAQKPQLSSSHPMDTNILFIV
ncbi:hypothetical protein M422DRAFT_30023 [Sphaerobolus stellatus SS14]|uniref:Unplaced genomic scaffold SPHSTscaffold_38, whole genome shotgun sequence n=1 Tax=Sphaerobolus stellatus (strain SS14) TaxID=990650 RepID=A0A0C9UQE7_SPHS4|nr:hypothetical protein M422DRAFT_30023 [Sphaerobolus stellatus SS14]